MTGAPVPGNDLPATPGARRAVIKLYLFRHDKGRGRNCGWIEIGP